MRRLDSGKKLSVVCRTRFDVFERSVRPFLRGRVRDSGFVGTGGRPAGYNTLFPLGKRAMSFSFSVDRGAARNHREYAGWAREALGLDGRTVAFISFPYTEIS